MSPNFNLRVNRVSNVINRPGDNQNNCADGYSCAPPTLTFDPYVPFQSRFIDVASGGPSPFDFTATSNVSWLTISPSQGSISNSTPEVRVFLTVDWSQVNGSSDLAQITFNASSSANISGGQTTMSTPAYLLVNKTAPPDNFTGEWSENIQIM